MTLSDATSLDRTAQYLAVDAKRAAGSPPAFYSLWEPVWGAKVDRIDINNNGKPSIATIWFPELRWQQTYNLYWGDMIRVRTANPISGNQTVLFVGFITSYHSEFCGGSEQPKSAYERCTIICQSYRWLLSVGSPIFGQRARGVDDYSNYGQADQAPLSDSYTNFLGRRAIFNENGKPNKDPTDLTIKSCKTTMPLFAPTDMAESWTARDMLCYLLSPICNKIYQYLPIKDASELPGVSHEDWDKVLNHIVVEGLNTNEAIELICTHLGWGYREDYYNDGTVFLTFYKVATADKFVRDSDATTILHRLHAPAAGEVVADAVADGRKMLWTMSLAEDIASVVNTPWALGAPHRFEITAELVPAWKDSDLVPDMTEDLANLYFTEAQLQDITDPNAKSYYKNYHIRGSDLKRDVGRKWALNESGRYSGSSVYDRGTSFDFANVIPLQYILDSQGKRIYGPFDRRLLPCLTVDKDTLNSVGIKVEFSFDKGVTWQVIPAAISSLTDESGIYIDEPNLAEMVDEAEGTISGGDLDGVQINYWTSLCDDKLESRSFKNGQWNTRIRITATVQMDQRLANMALPTPASGSPFFQSQIFDFSDKYGLSKRTASSIFASGSLQASETDPAEINWFYNHLWAIRNANQDMSISGMFVLDRFWLGDGSGFCDFAVGDCIEKITGREHNLAISFGGGIVYPQIIQIIYLPETQKMKLITRDLRFAEVLLD